MILPYAERAVVDIRKLRDYCLNVEHDDGKHKARLFAASLGMTSADAPALRRMLIRAVHMHDAQLGRRDAYGQRYIVDIPLEWHGRQAIIRTAWIMEHGSDVPRLTTCYPL
jgi:hypothetical protein